MRILKLKKKRTWHTVCDCLYSYTSRDQYYIVELTEKEFIKVHELLNKKERI